VKDALNKHLPLELAAHLRYNGHAQILSIRGYTKLADRYKEAAEEEMGHANQVMFRIQQLGGFPAYQTPAPSVKPVDGWNAQSMFESDLATETKVLQSLTALACKADEDAEDFETFRLCQELIHETEEDITWYRTQLALIGELGLQNYLQAQL